MTALVRKAMARKSWHRLADGKSKREVRRSLKLNVARQLLGQLSAVMA